MKRQLDFYLLPVTIGSEVSIPKSRSFEHQKENLDISDSALTEEEADVF